MSMGAAPTRAAAGSPVLWTALSEPSIELRQGQSCTWQHRLPCRATEHGFLWTFSLCYLKWRDGQGRAGQGRKDFQSWGVRHIYSRSLIYKDSLCSISFFLFLLCKNKEGKKAMDGYGPDHCLVSTWFTHSCIRRRWFTPEHTSSLSCMCPTVGTGCGGQRTTCQSFSPLPPRKRQGLFDRMHTCAYTYANTHPCKQSHGTQFSLLIVLNETNDMSTKYKGGTQSFCDALSK